MATSPIYNWPEPDNTDLVKNGALAIRTLGNAIDTTMATMVPKTIVDAKGDLIAGTAADTAARLAVGNNGETLVADSSTATGLRYQGTMAAGRNFANNGGFDIWQRGTSFAATGGLQDYTADRWRQLNNAGLSTYSRQLTNDTTNLPFIQYCLRVQRNSGQTATGGIFITQSLESSNSIPLAGRTVTFSFYARAGANFSASGNLLQANVNSGTGTDQSINAGFTGTATVISQTGALTTTWQRFTYTGTVASNVTQLGCYFVYTPTGTAGANDWFEVTGVQLELGSVATTFMRQGGTIQGELAACQRYYYRQGGTAVYETLGSGWVSSTTQAYGTIALPVSMRVIPTSIEYSTIAYQDNGGVFAPSAVAFSAPSRQQVSIELTCTGLTAGRGGRILTNNSTNGYLAFSAEL